MAMIRSGGFYNDTIAKAYSESSQTSRMEINTKIGNGLKP